MASQSNVSLNTRSMNGIITLSDGAGTTISNGEVTTTVLNVPFIPRTNLPESISGLWDFTTLPTSSVDAIYSNQFITKGHFDPIDLNNVKLTGNQAISGIKTFFTLPESAIAPTINNQFVNKLYVDTVGGNYVNRTTNQSIMGIKSFLTLPQAALAPTIGYEFTNKTYVDLIDNNNVKLTGNQTIYDQKTFNQGLTIVENGLLKLDAAGNNRISASFDNIITYNALTSHNFGTSSGMTTMSDGVYCKKLAVGLSGKAQTYLNYANIAHLITASTTLTSTYNTFLDSMYFVNMPSIATVVVITLPSVSNDNLGTVLSFYKTTSPLAEFQLLALSGQQIFSSKALYGSTQSMNFLNSTTYIKIVAVKTLSIFGWYVAIGLENAEANFASLIVQNYVHIKESGLFLGPTPIASVYYKDIYGLGIPSLALNCDNLGALVGSIMFQVNKVECGSVQVGGITVPNGKAFILDAESYGSIKMKADNTKLQFLKGIVGGLDAGIEFLINSAVILSLSPTGMNIGNKAIYLSGTNNGTGTSTIQSSSDGYALILHSYSGVNANIYFFINSITIGTVNPLGMFMRGYACKPGRSGNYTGLTFNFNWSGSGMECWIDNSYVGLVYLLSDYRLKENISYADKPVLERLCSLKLFEYDTKDISIFKPSGRHYGFFAHEIQELFPELENIITGKKDEVNADGDIHVQSVNMEVTNLYLRAIQELNALVKTLTERCDKQQIQIDKQQIQIDVLMKIAGSK